MNIVIIHDDRRPEEERVLCEKELDRQGIKKYYFWPANYIGETVQAAINLSHKQVVATAKEFGWEEVCIMESDVLFPSQDGWEYFLKNKPLIFDIYVSSVYSTDYERLRRVHAGLGTNAIPEWQLCGFHCYIIRRRFYDTFLRTPDNEHIDTAQKKGIFYTCYPFAAIQRPGWSANAKKNVDYNVTLLPQDVYGWDLNKKGPGSLQGLSL